MNLESFRDFYNSLINPVTVSSLLDEINKANSCKEEVPKILTVKQLKQVLRGQFKKFLENPVFEEEEKEPEDAQIEIRRREKSGKRAMWASKSKERPDPNTQKKN